MPKKVPKFVADYQKGRSEALNEILKLLNEKHEEGQRLIDEYDPDPDAVPHDGDPIGRRGPTGDPAVFGWALSSVCSELIERVKKMM